MEKSVRIYGAIKEPKKLTKAEFDKLRKSESSKKKNTAKKK